MPRKNKKNAGSNRHDEPAFLVLGKLRKAHGIQGEIPMEIYTHMMELLMPGCVIFIGDEYQPYTIDNTRWKQDLLLLKFDGIDDRETVSELTNDLVYVRTSDLPPLPDEEFYLHELIGLQVVQEDGQNLGILVEILETGANDVYLIKDDSGNEVLIPATEEMIISIDMDEGMMTVGKMEWYGGGD
jgi:16S rRNA processing protein RimM